MPDARTHDLITVATGALLVSPIYASQVASEPALAALNTGLFVGAHLISGILFSPDLDLDSAIDDRWGIFHWIWWPYTQLIPHRHFWSHGLLLPPLLRLGYFTSVLVVLLYCVVRLLAMVGLVVPEYHRQLADTIRTTIAEYPDAVAYFVAGFSAGGAAHSLADWLVTGGKRYLARLGFRTRRSYANHDRSLHRRGWYD